MSKKETTTWQNRIVCSGEKPASEFNFNPLNWRQHSQQQRSALNDVLSRVGWVTGVIENVRTGNLLDGHARVEEALTKGADTLVPFIQVDLSLEEEKQILAVLDPIGAMATTDAEKLQELVETLDFDSDALTDMLAALLPQDLESLEDAANASDEPNLNDPNFSYSNQYGVIVECDGELHQKEVFDRLTGMGLRVKVVVV